MSEFDLDRETVLAATDGPWEHRAKAWRIYGPRPCTCGECGDTETVCRVLCREIDDAAFIARARTRWPAALDEVERLERDTDLLMAIQKAVQVWKDGRRESDPNHGSYAIYQAMTAWDLREGS